MVVDQFPREELLTDDQLVESLGDQRRVLVAYLKSKTTGEDWHAVADAACDLREIDAKLEVLTRD